MLKTPIGLLRVACFIEGLSYLVMLFIAMPLKYFMHIPEVVSVVGMIHGIIIIIYVIIVTYVSIVIRWSIGWILGSLIVTFIPFGNFFLDAKLRRFKNEK